MAWSPASERHEIEDALRCIGGLPDSAIDLAEAALLLGALERPRVPLERYRHHLSQLARETAELGAQLDAADSLSGRAGALRAALVERHHYRGDDLTYDDPQNANLLRVIDRRKGLPVALGILFLHAGRAQGWAMEGLAFPGHFVVRLSRGAERTILDPFHGGIVRAPNELRDMLRTVLGPEAELRPEHTAPVENRDTLLRLRNNVKLRLIQGEQIVRALEVLESMLMIAPGRADLWREAGLLHEHLGNLRAALTALEHALDLGRCADERHDTARLLQRVRARLN